MGGFATAFDLISAEYGWEDDYIMDLPLARMQQIVSSIQLRKTSEQRSSKLETTWAVRSLAHFIVAGYMTDEKGKKEALAAVSKLTLDDIEREIQESDLPEEIEVPDEPRVGSYEALVQAFSFRG